MIAIIAPGAARRLRSHLDRQGARRIFLVTGAASYETSGARDVLTEQLAGLQVIHHRCTRPNPTLETVLEALSDFESANADFVVACGGGTPLDTAKLVLAIVGKDPHDVASGRAPAGTDRVLVAIPTTAGTGSEATHFASLYVDGRKRSVAHPSLRPAVALVDPELSASVPPRLTATTGLDALCQAVESHWSVRADPASRIHSRAALERIPAALGPTVHAPTPARRLAMAEGAFRAGQAIDRAFTTACHALSYHLTAVHGVAHGHAVALTLPPILRFNAGVGPDDALADLDATRAALADIVRALGVASPDAAAARVTALLAELGLPTRLAQVGCDTPARRAAMVDAVNPERLANNPRRLDRAALRAIVEEVA